MQPDIDQGIICTFKTYYHKYAVKYIIAHWATVSTSDNIKITTLDATDSIAVLRQAVSEVTVRNTFRLAGLQSETHNHLSIVILDSPTVSPKEDTTITNKYVE